MPRGGGGDGPQLPESEGEGDRGPLCAIGAISVDNDEVKWNSLGSVSSTYGGNWAAVCHVAGASASPTDGGDGGGGTGGGDGGGGDGGGDGGDAAPAEEFAVSFSVTASGDVADYTPAVKDSLASIVAAEAEVDKSKVGVDVTAGSVNIAFTITAATAAAATTAGNAVQASVATPSAATAFFSTVPSITITVDSVTAISAPVSTADDNEVEEDDPCFPSTAMVTKADGTTCCVDVLKEGDTIVAATADGMLTTDTVSLLSIAKPEGSAPMLTTLRAGNATLTLTPEHHVPVGVACCSELKKAKDVKVGDNVWAVRTAAPPLATTVTAKSNTQAKGLHSPVLTRGGFPVIDGIVTSFDTIDKVTLAKHGLAALIMACKATDTCAQFKELFVERK